MTIPLCLRRGVLRRADRPRIAARVLLCKTSRCGLTCDERVVSTSRGESFKCFPRALKSSLPICLSSFFLCPSRSRPRYVAPKHIVRFYKNVVFGLFRRPRYINGDVEMAVLRGRFLGYAKMGSCIGGNQFGTSLDREVLHVPPK